MTRDPRLAAEVEALAHRTLTRAHILTATATDLDEGDIATAAADLATTLTTHHLDARAIKRAALDLIQVAGDLLDHATDLLDTARTPAALALLDLARTADRVGSDACLLRHLMRHAT